MTLKIEIISILKTEFFPFFRNQITFKELLKWIFVINVNHSTLKYLEKFELPSLILFRQINYN